MFCFSFKTPASGCPPSGSLCQTPGGALALSSVLKPVFTNTCHAISRLTIINWLICSISLPYLAVKFHESRLASGSRLCLWSWAYCRIKWLLSEYTVCGSVYVTVYDCVCRRVYAHKRHVIPRSSLHSLKCLMSNYCIPGAGDTPYGRGHFLIPPPPSVESEPPFIITIMSLDNNLTVLIWLFSPYMSYP